MPAWNPNEPSASHSVTPSPPTTKSAAAFVPSHGATLSFARRGRKGTPHRAATARASRTSAASTFVLVVTASGTRVTLLPRIHHARSEGATDSAIHDAPRHATTGPSRQPRKTLPDSVSEPTGLVRINELHRNSRPRASESDFLRTMENLPNPRPEWFAWRGQRWTTEQQEWPLSYWSQPSWWATRSQPPLESRRRARPPSSTSTPTPGRTSTTSATIRGSSTIGWASSTAGTSTR